ncbi:MAG TPA: response regulator transcription factor [Chloroflexota bacterium]|nr:response regulator transcription factor [Chloroflexota bacterium]
MTRVLVIDDDLSIRQVIVYALADEGYQVDEAADGWAALALVGRQHPDIILVDMKMPSMDGWEFVKRYRALYDHRAAIIVLTAALDAAKRGEEVDAESYMSKPFDLDVLVERVSALAGVKSPDRSIPSSGQG